MVKRLIRNMKLLQFVRTTTKKEY